MPIDDDAVGIVKWGTGAGASDFNTPADVGFAEADGWPLAYGTPGSGSEPQREVFNWQWRRLTALAVELLTHGGGLPWDSRISYLHPASVMGSDGMLYQSVQDSTNQDPTTDASDTYWQQVGITLSDADIKTAYERNANTNALTDALLALLQGAAPLSSPAFTGAVTVPDQTAGTNNGRAANTRFVAAALAALVASAPSTLDTLNELADALGDDPNFAATVMTMLDNRPNNDAVIDLIRRNALSGPQLILQTTHSAPWNGGSAGTRQGLTKPHAGEWLDNSRAQVKAYGPLAGCSLVTGGIHFDWTDASIPSVDMIFELQGNYLAGMDSENASDLPAAQMGLVMTGGLLDFDDLITQHQSIEAYASQYAFAGIGIDHPGGGFPQSAWLDASGNVRTSSSAFGNSGGPYSRVSSRNIDRSYRTYSMTSGVITVPHNAYLLFAGAAQLTPFRVLATLLNVN